MRLILGDTCPVCGKKHLPTPPLKPNLDKEFFGGRVSFLKDVTCDCTAEYELCIERRFYYGEDRLDVIGMQEKKKGIPMEEVRKQEQARVTAEAEAKAIEAVRQASEENGEVPTLKQRQEIKRQVVLAAVPGLEEKIRTLTLMTQRELRIMCKRRKIKYAVTETKQKLAEKLLEYDPSLVVENPEG